MWHIMAYLILGGNYRSDCRGALFRVFLTSQKRLHYFRDVEGGGYLIKIRKIRVEM
jgi:hypothetical protein